MTDLLGELFPYAIGVALSPLPVIAVLLVLRSPSARAAGIAFLVGRIATVLVVATIAALLVELLPENDTVSRAGALLRILLGVVLMVWGVKKWLGRPQGDAEPELPGWMSSIENSTVPRAARLAVVLSILNLKELAFGIGAGLTIGTAGISFAETLVAASVYTVIACLGVIVPVVAFLVAEEKTSGALEVATGWLMRNNTAIIGGVLLVIGAILVGEGITAL